jgi:hypothetical protein
MQKRFHYGKRKSITAQDVEPALIELRAVPRRMI